MLFRLEKEAERLIRAEDLIWRRSILLLLLLLSSGWWIVTNESRYYSITTTVAFDKMRFRITDTPGPNRISLTAFQLSHRVFARVNRDTVSFALKKTLFSNNNIRPNKSYLSPRRWKNEARKISNPTFTNISASSFQRQTNKPKNKLWKEGEFLPFHHRKNT